MNQFRVQTVAAECIQVIGHVTHFPAQLETIATVLNMQGLDPAIKAY